MVSHFSVDSYSGVSNHHNAFYAVIKRARTDPLTQQNDEKKGTMIELPGFVLARAHA